LLAVRVCAQTGDALVQMGMLGYAIFSPQHQPSAWAIAEVLAVTYLPFSLIGPFISNLLDRWPRVRIAMVCDALRVLSCLLIAYLVGFVLPEGELTGPLLALLLLVLGINRFILAGLSAGLAETVKSYEYLDASSLMQIIGPASLILGGVVAGALRLFTEGTIPTHQSDALVFCLAALVFLVSIFCASRMEKNALGPKDPTAGQSAGAIWHDLVDCLKYLRGRSSVMQGLGGVAIQRTGYGALMVTTILAYRNFFHETTDMNLSIVDMGVWFGASGVGFALAVLVAPSVAHKIGIKHTILAMLVLSAFFQLLPGTIFYRITLVLASVLLGICFQSVKICTDTLVQEHVADNYRGRVFMLYDILNNSTISFGAVLAALLVPAIGLSRPFYLGIAGVFILEALLFFALSRHTEGWSHGAAEGDIISSQ
jgi:MFS family permease